MIESFSNMPMNFEQCVSVEFLSNENVYSTEIYNRLSNFYIEATIDINCVQRWIKIMIVIALQS